MHKVLAKIIENVEDKMKTAELLIMENPQDELDRIQTQTAEDFASAYKNAIEIVKQEAEQYNNGWIPVEEELPKDGDNRYYMCIVENHEEDPPMCCQYDEECGFGFYQDIYDEHTLGFVDCVFQTNEELGYEKVIAWQQLLPYQPKGE